MRLGDDLRTIQQSDEVGAGLEGQPRWRRGWLQARKVFLPVRGGAQLADVSPVKGRCRCTAVGLVWRAVGGAESVLMTMVYLWANAHMQACIVAVTALLDARRRCDRGCRGLFFVERCWCVVRCREECRRESGKCWLLLTGRVSVMVLVAERRGEHPTRDRGLAGVDKESGSLGNFRYAAAPRSRGGQGFDILEGRTGGLSAS